MDRHRKETQLHCPLLPGADWIAREPCLVGDIMPRPKVECLRNNRSINNLDLSRSPPSNPGKYAQNAAGEVTPMKASAFSYARATSVANALELLAAHGDGAKVLSGGQSLMPAMNLRLISQELLIDIGDLGELRGIALARGTLRIGALARHVELLNSPEIAAHAPLLTEAIAHVAHPCLLYTS